MRSLALKIIGFLISLMNYGLSLYLTYRILEHIKATEGMWIIYWINIPLLIFAIIINAIIGAMEAEIE